MSYTVQIVPDGTFPGARQWVIGVADQPGRTIAFVERSAAAEEGVLIECWRAACSSRAVQESSFRPVA